MDQVEKIQGQMLLLTVGMAFLIAVVVFGSGLGVLLWKIDQMERHIKAEFGYAEDMAEIRHRELEGMRNER